MLLISTLAACTGSQTIGVGVPDTAEAATPEVEAQEIPGSTDTAEPEDEEEEEIELRPLDAPVVIVIDCPAAIREESDVRCAMSTSWPDGTPHWSGEVAMHLRGRSSSDFPKPQYRVTLEDGNRTELSADLFGMGSEADWVLNGMWIDRARLALYGIACLVAGFKDYGMGAVRIPVCVPAIIRLV